MRNTADVIGGKPIAVLLQFVSDVNAINPLVSFTTSMEEKERCYSFILSRTPHETVRSHGSWRVMAVYTYYYEYNLYKYMYDLCMFIRS
jgi:hypothetical protein